jgi:Dullard-like phosphatase family protein
MFSTRAFSCASSTGTVSRQTHPVPAPSTPPRTHPNLPPNHHSTTLVLDLDETLIHSSGNKLPNLTPFVEFDELVIYKRPQVDDFLDLVDSKFDIYIFTSSEKPYADAILNVVRPSIDEKHRLYSTSVDEVNGKFHKDLTLFNRDLKSVILIDDNYGYYSFFPENTILVPAWKGDLCDFSLMCYVYPILEQCLAAPDVRSVISKLDQKRPN